MDSHIPRIDQIRLLGHAGVHVQYVRIGCTGRVSQGLPKVVVDDLLNVTLNGWQLFTMKPSSETSAGQLFASADRTAHWIDKKVLCGSNKGQAAERVDG